MRLLLAGVLLACLMPTPAAIAAPPDPAVEESIVVRGMTQRALRDEVDKMIAAPWDHQLARWGSTFCPDVEGLPAPYHDVVMEHVERAAHAAISDLSTTCEKANVFILFADDGSAAFDQILARSPDLGNHVPLVAINTGDFASPYADDIAELRTPRPVRWYRSTITDAAPGAVAIWSPRFHRIVAIRNIKVSQFELNTQARTSSVILIVDTNLATGARLGQLADYIAFIVLAGPKLGDDFDPISIMSLFDGNRFNPAAPPGLTRFDTTLLHALYEADPARQAHDEQAEISLIMHHDLARRADTADAGH